MIDESRGEVRRMIENVEHATGVTTLMCGYTLEDIAKDIDCMGHRQPIGVFAAIAPYNFPAMVPWWFLPYAIVSGNTYVLKPSEQVPMTQTKIFEIVDSVGLPEGVVNMVHGSKDVVNAILDHPDIAGVSFVGSSPTAKYIYERCGATGKRVQALGGAKNVVAVMPDAKLDPAMPSLITSYYGCSGQRCLSGAILAPVGDVADELIAKFMAAAKAVRLGDGLDEKTTMGPVVSAAHKQRVLGYIEKGIAEGAKLVLDGRNAKVEAAERLFRRPDDLRQRDARHDHRQGGDLRAGGERHPLQGHERGGGPGQHARVCQRGLHLHPERGLGARVQVQGQAEHDRGEHRHRRADVVFPVRRRRPLDVRRHQGPRPGDLPLLHGYEGGDRTVAVEIGKGSRRVQGVEGLE